MIITTIAMPEYDVDVLENLTPQDYNLDEAKTKNIVKNSIFEDDYVRLQAAYITLFNYYLCEKADIDKYQKEMDDYQYNFPCRKPTVSMKIGAFGRNNICIRNAFFIERLSIEQLEELKSSIDGDSVKVTESNLKMVEDTYIDVISVRYGNQAADEVVYCMFYYEDMMSVPNNAIVLEINTSVEYDEQGNADDNRDKVKAEFLNDLSARMADEMSQALGVKVFVAN